MNPEDALEAAEALVNDLRVLKSEQDSLRVLVDAQSVVIQQCLGRALTFQHTLEQQLVRESLKND